MLRIHDSLRPKRNEVDEQSLPAERKKPRPLKSTFDHKEKTMAFLQRHAESTANVSEIYACRRIDPDLTELGRTQAEAAAQFYSGKRIHRLLSSPSKRAVQTAEIIGSKLGLRIGICASLLEVDVGEFEGQSYRNPAYSIERFFSIFRDWLVEKSDTQFPGGESRKDIEKRLQDLEKIPPESPCVVVGHGALFAFFLGRRSTFGHVKDLFLPRAGIAYYSEGTRCWMIKKEVKQTHQPNADRANDA